MILRMQESSGLLGDLANERSSQSRSSVLVIRHGGWNFSRQDSHCHHINWAPNSASGLRSPLVREMWAVSLFPRILLRVWTSPLERRST